MEDQIRKILDKGKAENCNSIDEQKMFALFQQPGIAFKVKEKLLEDLLSDAYISDNEFNEFNTLLTNIWAKIEKKQKRRKK